MIKIEQLENVTTKAVEELNMLMPQLSSSGKQITYADLLAVLKDPNTTLMIVKEAGNIIGMGTLVQISIVTGHYGILEDIVVDEKYRGQGIGKQLCEKLIQLAREHKLDWLELTSRPTRVVANTLYPKLGFKKKETNVYELEL